MANGLKKLLVILVSAAVPMALCHAAYVAWFRRLTERSSALA